MTHNFSSALWSASEDAVILQHYASGGVKACLPHLPGRTRKAVMARAERLGCQSRPRRVLDAEGERIVSLLLVERERVKAQWSSTVAEANRLRRELRQLTAKAIAEKVGGSVHAVETIAKSRLWRRA